MTKVASISELISQLSSSGGRHVAADLLTILSLWIEDDDDILSLKENVENYIEGSALECGTERQHIETLWMEFCTSAIDCIHGMTMNERLFAFGLLDRFNQSRLSKEAVSVIYLKVLAQP